MLSAMGRTRTRDTYTYCAYHGVNRGHNSAECKAISQQFAKYNDIFYEFLQTRGLGPYETGRGGRGHKSSWLHPSYGRGRGRAEGFGPVPPPNFPPNFPPNLPPEPFHNGTRHDFSENYPYHNEYRGYSGWEATGPWSPPPAEDAYEYEYGVAAYERSFGEGPYGEVAGRYGFCHTPDDRHYFQQQRETTRKHYYGLSAAAPDTFQSRIYGDGYDISTDSRTPQQQQQHQHQQNATWAPLPQSVGGGDAVPLPRLHRPRRRWCHS